MTPLPAAIVLAGGASSRFGSDKLAADLAGRPVLEHTVAALAAVASPIVLVLAPDATVPAFAGAATAPAAVLIARDPVAFGGPLAGLAAGLEALAATPAPPTSASASASASASGIALVAGGDMPHLVPVVLQRLCDTLLADPALAAVTLEADPFSALPMAVRPSLVIDAARAIRDGTGRRSLRALLDAVTSVQVPAAAWLALDPAAETLRDIDTPADLG